MKVAGPTLAFRQPTAAHTIDRESAIWRDAFRVNPDAMFISTVADGRLIEVNEGFLRFFGCTRNQVVGHTTLELGIWPNREARDAFFNRLTPEGEGRDIEITVRRATGELFPVVISVVRLEVDGELCVLGVGKDITKTKRQERAFERNRCLLETVFRASPESIVVTSAEDGRIVEANPESARVSGYSRDELIGRTAVELGLTTPEGRARLVRALEERGEVKNLEMDTRHRSGQWFISEVSVARIELDGKPHHLGIGRDITARKQAEHELRITQKQLLQAGKMAAMGELAAGVAHEINNPLSAVLGFATLIKERLQHPPDDLHAIAPDLCDQLAMIEEGARQCVQVSQNMLSFARQSASEPERVMIAESVDAVLALLEGKLTRHRIHVTTNVAPQLVTLADKSELQQVFVNLVANAVDAQPGGGTISVNAEKYDDSLVLVEVTDTGTGIKDELLDHIFDPFFTTKKKGEGTGLGLSMVHSIIHRLGGTIDVDSSSEGTTFSIKLPLAQREDEAVRTAKDSRQPTSAPRVESISETKAALPRVLLVDDNTLARRVMERALNSERGSTLQSVVVAASGEEALELLKQESYDVLVTDFQMDGLNGLELTKEARKLHPGIAALLISGHSRAILEKDHDLSGVALLGKPVEVSVLREAVQRAGTVPAR